ncbi:serine hydrolase [Pigmentiphaga aceris]|uniref:beta-lactamase n=1 Tax=Pigmentiphaga aceris TaxID=1940612 RepID=A0A5C0ASD4_9BURK|nr:serine hydrolase [Pigmentiphaga aceris]QEI04504.1 serine hydrolase [Pigmentiphaga aceris]
MSRFSLSRRGFLHLAGGIAPFAIWPGAMLSATAAPVTASSSLPPNVCRINALLPALQDIAARANGDLGVSVIDLVGGASCAVRADDSFPLHSMVKLVVAASVAYRIEQGAFGLQTLVALSQATRPGGVGPLDVALREQGDQTASVERLLEAILLYSDNAACDGLMALVGGPSVINADLRRWSVADMRVDRTMRELYAPFNAAQTEAESRLHYEAWLADPRDRTTPTAYADFARRLAGGSLLGAQATSIVMNGWQRSTLTPNRITAGLGAGWSVASRSGTGPTVAGRTTSTNHAVLATSPAGRPVLVAAFLRNAAGADAERAMVLADVGRAVATACSTV